MIGQNDEIKTTKTKNLVQTNLHTIIKTKIKKKKSDKNLLLNIYISTSAFKSYRYSYNCILVKFEGHLYNDNGSLEEYQRYKN